MVWQPPSGLGLSPTTHAHPSLQATSCASLQNIRALFDELNIDFQLRGLPGADRDKISDVYCPEIRRSPRMDGEEVDHLDVVTCWKGISFSHASEIVYWEGCLKSSLEKIILDVISQLFLEYARLENEVLSRWTIIPCLIDFIKAKCRRLIDVSVPDFITDMIDNFYQGRPNTYKWFMSSNDLPSMIFNFIRTRDCFVDSFPYPSLDICFTYDQTGSTLCLFGDVKWQKPVIRFYDISPRLSTGMEYRITARYLQPELSNSFTSFPVNPEYLVVSKVMPLAWDSNKRCFRAIVPNNKSQRAPQQEQSQASHRRVNRRERSNTIETIFSAKLVMDFPGNVQFEKTSRYSLKLEVIPNDSKGYRLPFTPRNAHNPLSTLPRLQMDFVPEPVEMESQSNKVVSTTSPMDEISVSERVESIILSPPHEATNDTPCSAGHWPLSQALPNHWHSPYSNTPVSKFGCDSTCNSTLAESPNTSSTCRVSDSQTISLNLSPKVHTKSLGQIDSQFRPNGTHLAQINLGNPEARPESNNVERKVIDDLANLNSEQRSANIHDSLDSFSRRYTLGNHFERYKLTLRKDEHNAHEATDIFVAQKKAIKRALNILRIIHVNDVITYDRALAHAIEDSRMRFFLLLEKIDEFDHMQSKARWRRNTVNWKFLAGRYLQRAIRELFPKEYCYTASCAPSIPQKRKASKQMSTTATHDMPLTHYTQDLVLKGPEDKSAELAAKRQRLNDHDDSGIVIPQQDMAKTAGSWSVGLRSAIEEHPRDHLSEASRQFSPTSDKSGLSIQLKEDRKKRKARPSERWFPIRHNKSMDLPTEKRAVLQRRKGRKSDSPPTPKNSNTEASPVEEQVISPVSKLMHEIQHNYNQYLNERREKEKRASQRLAESTSPDEDEKAMTRVFLEGSGSEGSGSEGSGKAFSTDLEWESDYDDLSEILNKALNLDSKVEVL